MDTKTVTDGITTERHVVVSAKTTAADFRAYADSQAALNTFDARVAGWERWNAKQPRLPDDPTYGSIEWYRRQIAVSIAAARAAVAAGDVQLAMSEALDVGLLLKERHAKTWPDLQLGRTYRADQRDRALRGAKAKREDGAPKRARLLTKIQHHRKAHPHDGPRAIARALLPRTADPATIDRVRKRIARALATL